MDLISSLSIVDWVAGVSAVMILGTFSSAMVSVFSHLWSSWATNPVVQAVVNNTLVLLKNTEVVWRPVLNTSLVILKPIISFALMILRPFGEKALIILKPFGTVGLVVLDKVVKGMVIFGYLTTYFVLSLVQGVRSFMNYTKSIGLDFASAVKSGAFVLKDFTLSLAKIVQWVGYVIYQIAFSVKFVLDSCEQVGTFLHRLVFEAHKVTWNDVYNISIPFLVVGSILAFFVWRVSLKFASKPFAPSKKVDDECFVPRRSSRLARKRALMYCQDLPSAMLSSEKSSSTPTNL